MNQLYLSGSSRPDFERIIVRTGDDSVTAKLQASDDMVVVTFQLARLRYRSNPPV